METIRFAKIGKEDLRLGTSTFKVTLADGREVVLTEVDMCDLGSDQTVTGVKTLLGPILSSPTLTDPQIIGTVSGGATYTVPTLNTPTLTSPTAARFTVKATMSSSTA